MTDENRLKSIEAYLCQLSKQHFYGTVSVRMDNGRIVLLNLQQALKPETLQQIASAEESKPRRIDEQDKVH